MDRGQSKKNGKLLIAERKGERNGKAAQKIEGARTERDCNAKARIVPERLVDIRVKNIEVVRGCNESRIA